MVVKASKFVIKNLTEDQIVFDNQPKSERTFEKEFCRQLADSIESDGLQHPPVVNDNGDGTYTVISGRNRVFVMAKILKWEQIPCSVVTGLDDEARVQLRLAENLYRSPLSKLQRQASIARWFAYFCKQHPEKVGSGSHMKKALAGDDSGDKETVSSFSEQVSAALGVAKTVAKQLTRNVKMISPEQFEALDKVQGISDNDVSAIADLGDKEAVGAAVNLIASGMPVSEAIRHGKSQIAKKAKEKAAQEAAEAKAKAQITKGTETKRKPGRPRSEKPKVAEPPPNDDDLTTEQWCDKYCSRILKGLKRVDRFYSDVQIYRDSAKARDSFRKSMLPLLKKRGDAVNGAFYFVLFRQIWACHPDEWIICPKCKGTGVNKAAGEDCPACGGHGYRVKSQRTT
jgi:hypothetical protein